MLNNLLKHFQRTPPNTEHKRQRFAAGLIYEHTNDVLSSLAMPHEDDWTAATRATIFGYVYGSTFEYSLLGMEPQKKVVLAVLQRFSDKKLDARAINAELYRYETENEKYYELGLRAAAYDYKAGLKGHVIYAFLEAVRYPDETTFDIEDVQSIQRVR